MSTTHFVCHALEWAVSGLAEAWQQKELCNKSASSLKWAGHLPHATCHNSSRLQVPPLTRRACSASYADPNWDESWTCATWLQRAASAIYPAALLHSQQQQQRQLLPLLPLLLQLLLLLHWRWHAAYSDTSWRCHLVPNWRTGDAMWSHHPHRRRRHHDVHDDHDDNDADDVP